MSFFHADKLYIDGSTMRDASACRTYAALSSLHGLKSDEECINLKCGHAAHLLLEYWWKTWDRQTALDTFDEDYSAWSDEHVSPDHPKRWSNARAVLDAYMDRTPREALPFSVDPKYVEVPFVTPLDDHINFYGRMDAIVTKDGHSYVLDHKTTGSLNANWGKQWYMSSQVSGYVWAAKQQVLLPCVGAYIQGIEIKNLNISSNTCKTHSVPFNECRTMKEHLKFKILDVRRSDEQLDAWRQAALAAAYRYWQMAADAPEIADIPEIPMDGMFTGACFTYNRTCPFHDFCTNGKPMDRVHQMFRYDPWEPTPLKEELEREMVLENV